METITTPSSILPGQQLPLTNNIPQAVASGAQLAAASATTTATRPGSGPIGPFFAVMSVLAILLVGSCLVDRVVDRKAAKAVCPLESVRYGDGWFGWLMRRWTRCVVAGDLEVGRGKVVAEE